MNTNTNLHPVFFLIHNSSLAVSVNLQPQEPLLSQFLHISILPGGGMSILNLCRERGVIFCSTQQ